MISVLLVDDHPALRAGLMAVLRTEPGIVPVGTASTAEDLWPQYNRTRPDLVVLDYHLPGTDGLILCRKLKQQVPAPAVLIYSAYADASLSIPALLASADGLVHKGVPANELSVAIRSAARGQKILPRSPKSSTPPRRRKSRRKTTPSSAWRLVARPARTSLRPSASPQQSSRTGSTA